MLIHEDPSHPVSTQMLGWRVENLRCGVEQSKLKPRPCSLDVTVQERIA
jgi:hypothetical protein